MVDGCNATGCEVCCVGVLWGLEAGGRAGVWTELTKAWLMCCGMAVSVRGPMGHHEVGGGGSGGGDVCWVPGDQHSVTCEDRERAVVPDSDQLSSTAAGVGIGGEVVFFHVFLSR